DRFFGIPQLNEMLPLADFVVLALPLAPDAEHLIDESRLRLMKPSAYLVNVARPTIIDLDALRRALKGGWIAGAAVDVWDPPPGSTSDFWDLPNLIITPWVMGSRANPKYDARCNQIFIENTKRYLAGAPLLNRVNPTLRY